MWPDLVTLGSASNPITVHSYGLMVMLAFIASLGWVHARSGTVGLSQERVAVADLAAAIGGLFGAKLLYAVTEADASSLTTLSAGFVWYGGVLGGLVAVVAVSLALRVDVWKLADVVAPALAMGAAFGRLGCWFAGCCHGTPVPTGLPATPLLPEGTLHGQLYLHPSFPWLSNTFDGGAARWTHVALFPTQLWQSVGSALIAVLLLVITSRRRFDGQVFAVWLLLDPILRAFVEAFRGDDRGLVVSWKGSAPAGLPGLGDATGQVGLVGITTSQAIGLVLVLVGLVILVARRHAGVKPEVASSAWGDDLVDDV